MKRLKNMITSTENFTELDRSCTSLLKIEAEQSFEKREQEILSRIKLVYGKDLQRVIPDSEAKEIAENLLAFSKVIYGIE